MISRRVTCQRIAPPSREAQTVDDRYCQGQPRPAESAPCHADVTCQELTINSDPSNYVQLQQRDVRLSAGGEATLIPGARFRLRCPISGVDREGIEWVRDGLTHVPRKRGRVHASKGGGLLIFKTTEMHDRGVYTCRVGGASASFSLRFHSHDTAFSLLRARATVRRDSASFLSRVRRETRNYELTEPALRRMFNSRDLPVSFLTSEWGLCTQSCGGAGFQSRVVTCEINFDTYYLVVDTEECFSRGLTKPLDKRDCGFGMCPYWEVGQEGSVSTRVLIANSDVLLALPFCAFILVHRCRMSWTEHGRQNSIPVLYFCEQWITPSSFNVQRKEKT